MRRLLPTLLVLALGTPGLTLGESLVWLYPDFAPYYIVEGRHAGAGTHDERLRLLQAAIPGWTHESVVAPSARINRQLESDELVCSLARTRTPEREALYLFSSVPSTLAFPIGLAVTRDSPLGQDGDVSLFDLLGDGSDFTLGVAAGRSYGASIDSLVGPYRGTKRIEERAAGDIYGGLVRMLVAHRIDAVLGFAPELRFIGEQQGVADRIRHVGLIEQTGFSLGYPVCTDTPQGRKVIRQIEDALRVLRAQDPWRLAAERWLDEASLPRYQAAYENLLLQAD